MATLRELKGRIASVASSEKITGAMKMISSAKMHKAEQALRRLQPFRRQVETIIGNLLLSDATFSSPLMAARAVKRVALVTWGSDDGLCGAYNANIFKQIVANMAILRERYGQDTAITVLPIGGKMCKATSRLKLPSTECLVPVDVDSKSAGEKVNHFTLQLCQDFTSDTYDAVYVLYMNFQSVSRQRPVCQQLLPVQASNFESIRANVKVKPYLFEPSPEAIFTRILPLYLMAVTEDIFTENRASEQAARVMAMQSANDNAKKLYDQLHLEYNKLRQQAITTELLDILGGQVK